MNRFCSTSLGVILLGCTPKGEDSGLLDVNTLSCLEPGTPTGTFELFSDLPTTQIHADIAFDGQWIWTVFNLPNADSDFDVYLGAIDCTGNVVAQPKQILDIPGLNQTTPRIAISNDNIILPRNQTMGSKQPVHPFVQTS